MILLLALLLFGPKRLPEIGRTLGKALGEFRRSTNDLKRSIQTEMTLEEIGAKPPEHPRRPEVAGVPEMEAGTPAPARTEARTAIEPPPPELTTLDVAETVEPEVPTPSDVEAATSETTDREPAS